MRVSVLLVALLAAAPATSAPADAPLLTPTLEPAPPPAPAPVVPRADPAPWPLDSRSVYKINLWVDAPLVLAAGLGAILPPVFDARLIRPRCPCDPREALGIDRGVIGFRSSGARLASDISVWLAIAAPVVLDVVDVGFSWPLLEDVVVYLEVVAFSNALVNVAKYGAQRPRPFVYAGLDPAEAAKPDAYASFYSSHASNAFAMLVAGSMTYTLRHGARWWPWLVTALVGTSVAIERVFAGQHFPTDVVVGAAAGAAVGWLIPWLHARAHGTLSFTPVQQGGGVVTWSGRL